MTTGPDFTSENISLTDLTVRVGLKSTYLGLCKLKDKILKEAKKDEKSHF